ncbi:thioredoxin-like protein [Flagelloscypha sp. PMI_526]|nr:thioredoxin-like protein [Flagelloscypha sp. PMI_526]
MVLKFHGFNNSPCGKRVGIICQEKKIPFEFIQVDITKGQHKSPEYMQYQPFGQVPYIEDNGFIVYESRAICRYLDDKYDQGPKLVPTDIEGKALFEQAASIESFNFDPFAFGAVREKLFKPQFIGAPADMEIYNGFIARLETSLDAYESILSKQPYLAGNTLTLVDLFHLPYGVLLAAAGSSCIIDEKRPHVARWWKGLVERESWNEVKDGLKSTSF